MIGLAAAAGLTRLMKSLLFGISTLDPVIYTAMPFVLAAAALLARIAVFSLDAGTRGWAPCVISRPPVPRPSPRT